MKTTIKEQQFNGDLKQMRLKLSIPGRGINNKMTLVPFNGQTKLILNKDQEEDQTRVWHSHLREKISVMMIMKMKDQTETHKISKNLIMLPLIGIKEVKVQIL